MSIWPKSGQKVVSVSNISFLVVLKYGTLELYFRLESHAFFDKGPNRSAVGEYDMQNSSSSHLVIRVFRKKEKMINGQH